MTKGSSPNFASNIKQIWANRLPSMPPGNYQNAIIFLMISGGLEVY